MAVNDFASVAAAQSAGYAFEQLDAGAGKSPRYVSRFSKPIVGEPGSAGGLFKAEGAGSDVQATADANALASLNAQRRHRYGGSPGRASGGANSPGSKGGSMTEDTH
jgi:hypothetical protein